MRETKLKRKGDKRMRRMHHGHLIQIIWIIIGTTIQIFFIKGIEGFIVNLIGILLTCIYSLIVANRVVDVNQSKEVKEK